MDSYGHNFIPAPFTVKMKYGLVAGDKMCKDCGIIINEYDCIVSKNRHGNFRDTLKHISKYELNCNEIMIKQLLE